MWKKWKWMKLSLQNGWNTNACRMWRPEHWKIAMLEKMLLEPCRNYLKLFGIILHSQLFTQTVLRFLFHLMFFLFEITEMAIAVAANYSFIVLSVEIKIKEVNKQSLYDNMFDSLNSIIQTVLCKSSLDFKTK